MLARRLLLYIALVLLVLSLASLLAAGTESDDEASAPPAAGPTRAMVDRLEATLPSEQPVEAAVGDVVALTIRTDEAGRAEIRGLGVDVPIGPGLDVPVVLPLERTGRFIVTRRLSDERLGTLVVRPR